MKGKAETSGGLPVRFAGAIIVLAGLAAYADSLGGPFVFDDPYSIARNPTIRHAWPDWGVLFPPANLAVAGRPVLNLSFWFNYTIGGLNVRGYHALNLAVHLLAGLVLFGIVRRTLVRLGGRVGADATGLALAAGLLWTLHPVQTAAVTYVCERAESLMGLFYLLTLWCFIRHVDAGDGQAGNEVTGKPVAGSGHRAAVWAGLCVVFCLLGMATKEVMVTAPLLVWLYDRAFVAGGWGETWRRRGRLHLALACTWILPAGLMLNLNARGVGYGLGVSWWRYALEECRVVLRYLRLAVWPHPLVFDYGPVAGKPAAGFAVALGVLVAAVLILFWRRPRLGFPALWFLVILAPTSSVVPVAFAPAAENRMYLSLAGVIVLTVIGLHALLGRRGLLVCAALAAGCGALTARRNLVYRREEVLWSDTVKKRPDNPRAHYNLGCVWRQLGREEKAAGEYVQALDLDPNYVDARINLGNVLVQLGRVPAAAEQYQKALRLEPKDAELRGDLANVLAGMGRTAAAEAEYRRALRDDPGGAWLHYGFGNFWLQTGRLKEAIAEYQAALRIAPDSVEVLNNLGNALVQTGDMAAAVAQYRAILRIESDNFWGHFNLGLALAKMPGRRSEALAELQAAQKIDPGNAEVRGDLAQLRAARP